MGELLTNEEIKNLCTRLEEEWIDAMKLLSDSNKCILMELGRIKDPLFESMRERSRSERFNIRYISTVNKEIAKALTMLRWYDDSDDGYDGKMMPRSVPTSVISVMTHGATDGEGRSAWGEISAYERNSALICIRRAKKTIDEIKSAYDMMFVGYSGLTMFTEFSRHINVYMERVMSEYARKFGTSLDDEVREMFDDKKGGKQ